MGNIGLCNQILKNKNAPNIRGFSAQRGFFTLPSWLIYTAPANRTAMTGQSVMLRNVPANQPVGTLIPTNLFDNGYIGLRLEPVATNYCLYSENFSQWTNLHATINATNLTDPAGGTTAWDISSASGYSGLYTPTNMVYQNPANPIICLSGWFLNAGPDPSNGAIAILGTNGDLIVDYLGLPAYHQPPYNQMGWSRIWYIDQNYDYGVLYTEIGNRPEFQVFDTRAKYAFIQCENTPYPTSYMPTQGSPVTRAASILSFIPYKHDGTFNVSITFGMALSTYWQTGFTILSDSTGTKSIRMISNNHMAQIQSIIGDVVTDSTQLTWADSDNLTCHVIVNGPAKTYTAKIIINGITVRTFTGTHASPFDMGSRIYIGSQPDGTNMIPTEGVLSVYETTSW